MWPLTITCIWEVIIIIMTRMLGTMLVVYLSFEEFYFSSISFWWRGFFFIGRTLRCAVSWQATHALIGLAPIVMGRASYNLLNYLKIIILSTHRWTVNSIFWLFFYFLLVFFYVVIFILGLLMENSPHFQCFSSCNIFLICLEKYKKSPSLENSSLNCKGFIWGQSHM